MKLKDRASFFSFFLRSPLYANDGTNKTSLTPPLLIEVPEPNQESPCSYTLLLGVSILPLFEVLIFEEQRPVGSESG